MIPSPIKWHGGKTGLANRFIDLFPSHVHYVEPYAGSLAVLFAKPYIGFSEVVNDLNGDLTNFWLTLQNPATFEKFRREVEAIPFSEVEYTQAETIVQPNAVAFFVLARMSMAGRFRNFAPITRNRTRRDMNEQASAWLSAVDGLTCVHDRLRRVVILNRDALDVIRQQDGENTFFYLDPPYLFETRATVGEYAVEMDDRQHEKLLRTLTEVKGKFMLSGYRSKMYDDYAHDYRWRRVDFDTVAHSAGGDTKGKRVECVWMNY